MIVLLNPTTLRCLSILSMVILLSAPPMLTVPQVPLTVSVLFDPPTFSDLPSPQSRVVVVPIDPKLIVLPMLNCAPVLVVEGVAEDEAPGDVVGAAPLFSEPQPASPNIAVAE